MQTEAKMFSLTNPNGWTAGVPNTELAHDKRATKYYEFAPDAETAIAQRQKFSNITDSLEAVELLPMKR